MGSESTRENCFSAPKYARNFRSSCACHSQTLLHDIQTHFILRQRKLCDIKLVRVSFSIFFRQFFSLLCASFFQFCFFLFTIFPVPLAQTSFFALIWFERLARVPRINTKRNDCTQTKLISFAFALFFRAGVEPPMPFARLNYASLEHKRIERKITHWMAMAMRHTFQAGTTVSIELWPKLISRRSRQIHSNAHYNLAFAQSTGDNVACQLVICGWRTVTQFGVSKTHTKWNEIQNMTEHD